MTDKFSTAMLSVGLTDSTPNIRDSKAPQQSELPTVKTECSDSELTQMCRIGASTHTDTSTSVDDPDANHEQVSASNTNLCARTFK
jgi:hypothetical protein